jgi:Zn-dependent protease with chaperone function
MENQATTAQPQKKSLVSRKAWIVISIISLLIALSNASKSGANGPLEFLPVLLGGFIGGLLLLGGGWGLIMGASRWLSRRRSAAATRK